MWDLLPSISIKKRTETETKQCHVKNVPFSFLKTTHEDKIGFLTQFWFSFVLTCYFNMFSFNSGTFAKNIPAGPLPAHMLDKNMRGTVKI